MKTFNKVISIVTAIVFVFSMMIVPAFAAGIEGIPKANGAEKLTVTYYSDEALTNAITTAEPGSTVYAKITANLPTGTLRDLSVDLSVANATIESDNSLLNLTGFERTTVEGKTLNTIFNTKTGANIYIGLVDGVKYDSPTNVDDFTGDYIYTNIGVTSFDITSYKLIVGDSGTVSFSNAGGVGLAIGVIETELDTGDILTTPFTIEGTLAIGGGVTTKDATFVADFDEDFEYANTLSNSELETAIKADLTVTKTVDGASSNVDVSTLDINFNHTAKTFTVKFAKGLATGEVIKSGTDEEATFSYKVKAPAVVDYTYDHVEFNGAKVEGGRVETAYDAKYLDDTTLKNAFVVYGKKTVDSVATEEVVAVPTDIGNVTLGRSATSNDVSIFVHFKGTNITSITLGFTNIPTTYSNAKATLTGSPFANNTTAENVKNAVAVTATKTYGKVVTNDVPMEKDTDYEVTIAPDTDPLTSGDYTATVTVVAGGKLNGLTIENGTIEFAVADAVYTYKNYAIKYDQREFNATDDKAYISSKVKVVADKYEGETLVAAEELVTATNYIFDIDEDGNITITFKVESSHSGAPTLNGSVTLKDVIEYRNVKATMSTRMFPAGTTDDTIKRELTIVADKYVNNVLDGAEQSTLPAEEYTVTVETVDTNNKKVKITYSEKCISVADAYKEFAVAVGITANAKITLGAATVNIGDDLKATVNIEGLAATDKIYGAVVEFNITTGAIKNVNIATGYNKVDSASDIKMKEATITLARDMSGTATNKLFEFAIDTTGLAKDDVITVTVTSLKLTTVEGDDVATLPSFTGDSASATVTEVVVPTTAKINASFDIKTLGDVTSAADKFKAGLKVTKGTDAVTLGADNVVVTEKKVELKDLEVEAGVYKVSVDVPGYTKAEVEIKVIYDSETNTMNVTSSATGREAIYAGDVDGNGSINAKDYADLVAKIGQAAAENVNCDLYTKDGEANISVNDIITMVYEFETYFGATITSAGLIVE